MTSANSPHDRRRLQDRIEALVTKALGIRNSDELDRIIEDLRKELHEHSKRLREADAFRSNRTDAA